MEPEARVKTHAAALGFDAVGIAKARLPEARAADLTAFLDQGLHGTMDWLARCGQPPGASSWSAPTTGRTRTRWRSWRGPTVAPSRSMPAAATITT
jgi:hypothetical protein